MKTKNVWVGMTLAAVLLGGGGFLGASATPSQALTPADVSTGNSNLGTITVNGVGLTAYVFANDVADSGKSNCYGNCAAIWPAISPTNDPLVVEGVTGTVGTITRTDDTKQITINGLPVYTFHKDLVPGDTYGQLVNNIWNAVDAAGNKITTANPAADVAAGTSNLGPVAVNSAGKTAYVFANDVAGSGVSNCNGNCATIWPPITTTSDYPVLKGVTGTVGTITRTDGTKQVTLNGLPVYTFHKDLAPGDTYGQLVNNIWNAVDLAGQKITTANPIEPPVPTTSPVPTTPPAGKAIAPAVAVSAPAASLAETGGANQGLVALVTALVMTAGAAMTAVRRRSRSA